MAGATHSGMTPDDGAPIAPAIPLRLRQRHKPRTKKRSRSASEPVAGPSEAREEAEARAPFDSSEESFFSATESSDEAAPDDRDDAPSEPHVVRMGTAPRRQMLLRLVTGTVLASLVICLGAVGSVVARTLRPASVAVAAPTRREMVLEAVTPEPTAIVTAVTSMPSAQAFDASAEAASTAIEKRERARALLSKRAAIEAITVAKEAANADPRDAEGWLILGAAQMEAGRQADAIASFRSCSKVAKVGPVAECRAFAR